MNCAKAAALAALMASYEQGHVPALLRILDLCQLWRMPLPAKAKAALAAVLVDKHFAPGKENRRSNPRWRYRNDYKAFARWRAVSDARWKLLCAETDGMTNLAIAGNAVLLPPYLPQFKGGRPRKGKTAPYAFIDKAVMLAAEQLKGTIASGSARQIKDDYLLVLRAKVELEDAEKGKTPARYDFDPSEPVPKTSADRSN